MELQFLTPEEARQILREELKSFFPAIHNIEPQAPIIMTGDAVCEKLDITIATLIRWRQKGKIPFLQIGSSIRYDFNKVLQALEVNKKKGSI